MSAREDTLTMTATVPQTTCESVYGSTVDEQEQRDREGARAEVQAERARKAEWESSVDARDDKVRAYYAAHRGEVSDNELARRLDLNPSTFRSIINRAPRSR